MCEDGGFGGLISKITFYSSDGTVQETGKNSCTRGKAKKLESISFPSNSVIVGVNTWLGKSPTGFEGITTTQWLYYIGAEN